MKTLTIAAVIVIIELSRAFAGGYDNPTPVNASAINAAAGVSQPVEPRADTTREGMVRSTGNGGN